MKRVQRSREALNTLLIEQLDFLKFSSDEFDNGRDAEANRLALSLRVLLHDTKRSHSVLGQLGMLDQQFYDISWPIDQTNLLTTHRLVSFFASKDGTKYRAHLDNLPESRKQHFFDWWTDFIFVDEKGRQLTRRDLVLTCADQDGGAHVDPEVEENYFDLEFKNSLGWKVMLGDEKVELGRPGRVAIRQIAHETLKTLIKNYQKMPVEMPGIWLGGASVTISDPK